MASDAVKFAQEVIECRAWRIKGVGPYGTDVDVVALDAYKELAQRCQNAEDTCLMWARKALALENPEREPSEVVEEAKQRIIAALHLPASAIGVESDG